MILHSKSSIFSGISLKYLIGLEIPQPLPVMYLFPSFSTSSVAFTKRFLDKSIKWICKRDCSLKYIFKLTANSKNYCNIILSCESFIWTIDWVNNMYPKNLNFWKKKWYCSPFLSFVYILGASFDKVWAKNLKILHLRWNSKMLRNVELLCDHRVRQITL